MDENKVFFNFIVIRKQKMFDRVLVGRIIPVVTKKYEFVCRIKSLKFTVY